MKSKRKQFQPCLSRYKEYEISEELKKALAEEIRKEIDKEIITSLLGENWEIALEFNMIAIEE